MWVFLGLGSIVHSIQVMPTPRQSSSSLDQTTRQRKQEDEQVVVSLDRQTHEDEQDAPIVSQPTGTASTVSASAIMLEVNENEADSEEKTSSTKGCADDACSETTDSGDLLAKNECRRLIYLVRPVVRPFSCRSYRLYRQRLLEIQSSSSSNNWNKNSNFNLRHEKNYQLPQNGVCVVRQRHLGQTKYWARRFEASVENFSEGGDGSRYHRYAVTKSNSPHANFA